MNNPAQTIRPVEEALSPQRQTPGAIRALTVSSAIFIFSWVVFYLVRGAVMAFLFDGAAGNGPFQIYNPLRRIADGQTPGTDFVFYHGIGVPYLLYPLFALFGGQSIQASELSRQWTSLFLWLLPTGAFLRALLGRCRRFWVALAACLVFIEALYPGAAEAGLSQIGIRAAMPIFTFAALLLPIGQGWKSLLVGAFMGLAVPFGTEHGIALIMAFTAASTFTICWPLTFDRDRGLSLRNARFFAGVMLAAVATASLSFLLLAGWQGTQAALHYALIDLPADKFWFDGTPPNPYLGEWSDLVHSPRMIRVLAPAFVALALLLVIGRQVRRNAIRLADDWEILAVMMLSYGILSCIGVLGVYSKHYVLPLVRVLALGGALLLAKSIVPRVNLTASRIRSGSLVSSALLLAISTAMIGVTVVRLSQFVDFRRSGPFTYSPNFSQRWNSFMSRATRLVDMNRRDGKPSLMSTYAGLLESDFGLFSPAEDYITLSAGPRQLSRYIDKLRSIQPELVQTTAPGYAYEEWLQNVRWPFYEDVINNYEPLARIGHAVFWKRKPRPWVPPAADFAPINYDARSNAVILESFQEQEQLGIVRIHYTVNNPWRRLPVLGLTPRYMAMISGGSRRIPVSFPPYLAQYEFPVQLPANGRLRIAFVTKTLLPGASYHVDRVELKRLPYSASQRQVLHPLD